MSLRERSKEIDSVVVKAYGWLDINLDHDFYEIEYLPENDRTRYTINPTARKEILRRLLSLNHQFHYDEISEMEAAKAVPKKERSGKKTSIGSFDLFSRE